MEGRSHYSDKQHNTFLARFKGKINMIDKSGHLGIVAASGKPIEKAGSRHPEIYKSCSIFNPYASMDHSSLPSTLPSSRMSSQQATDAVLSSYNGIKYMHKYYTPTGMTSGYTSKNLDNFSRACDFFGSDHRKSCNYEAAINPLRYNKEPVVTIPRKNIQKVGVMSLKETPRYGSIGKGYGGAAYSVKGFLADTAPASTTTLIRSKKYSAHIAYPRTGGETPVVLSQYPQHYDYAKQGSYIIAQPQNVSPSVPYYR